MGQVDVSHIITVAFYSLFQSCVPLIVFYANFVYTKSCACITYNPWKTIHEALYLCVYYAHFVKSGHIIAWGCPSVHPYVHKYSCMHHNSVILKDIFMQIYRNTY